MVDDQFKSKLISSMGQEKYDKCLETLGKLEEKANAEGKFEEIKDLIDQRGADKKSTKLHAGFEVFAGVRGSKLSGGQKQRIAIARAVVRAPQILLLDEATSALDENSQKLVQEALTQIMKDRTSIVIAHRLTTVESCSRIAVINDGVIVEDGAPAELKQKDGGHFANLAKGLQKAEKKEQKRLSLLAAH